MLRSESYKVLSKYLILGRRVLVSMHSFLANLTFAIAKLGLFVRRSSQRVYSNQTILASGPRLYVVLPGPQ